MNTAPQRSKHLLIVGAGPAGLMAAWIATQRGLAVTLYEAKASVGRKFLIAGRGGLNLTHSEGDVGFRSRFGSARPWVGQWLDRFDARASRAFANELGIETFVGSSGRVFPRDMKAAPMLRTWVQKLRDAGVRIHVRHRLLGLAAASAGGWELAFDHDGAAVFGRADAVLLALGGASWPQLGSDGRFVDWLSPFAELAPWQAANCGFDVAWSTRFKQTAAGKPLKSVRLSLSPDAADTAEAGSVGKGECVIADYGLEGSLIYAHSRAIRDGLAQGVATLHMDLSPDVSTERLRDVWGQFPKKRTLVERLRRLPGMDTLKTDLCLEVHKHFGLPSDAFPDAIKHLPIPLQRPRPVAEAISSAGGVMAQSVDESLMLRAAPGVFCAGEMLDWEAPTGGYLLTASMASGVIAAEGAANWLQHLADASLA